MPVQPASSVLITGTPSRLTWCYVTSCEDRIFRCPTRLSCLERTIVNPILLESCVGRTTRRLHPSALHRALDQCSVQYRGVWGGSLPPSFSAVTRSARSYRVVRHRSGRISRRRSTRGDLGHLSPTRAVFTRADPGYETRSIAKVGSSDIIPAGLTSALLRTALLCLPAFGPDSPASSACASRMSSCVSHRTANPRQVGFVPM